MVQRYRPAVDVHVILVRDGQVLLTERQGTGYADGLCHLPSGHLEADESVLDGAAREAREEVGVTIDPADLRCVTVLHHRSPEGDGRVGFFFETTHWAGEPHNREPHKCAKLSWHRVDMLPHNTVPYCTAGIDHYRTGATFGLHGWS